MASNVMHYCLSEDDNNRNGKNMHKGWGLHHQHRLLENVCVDGWLMDICMRVKGIWSYGWMADE